MSDKVNPKKDSKFFLYIIIFVLAFALIMMMSPMVNITLLDTRPLENITLQVVLS